MPTLPPQTQPWPSDRALLFIHGIGNPSPGDYNALVQQVETLLGGDAAKFAIYFLYYDQINQWIAAKLQVAQQCEQLVDAIKSAVERSAVLASQAANIDAASLSNVVADFAADVIWPVLVPDARHAVRAAILQQLAQIVLDGKAAGHEAWEQRITIIAHSLGCFHTYEALYAVASDPGLGLSPATFGVQFENVIYMASPVQLIRTVANALGDVVPERDSLHCLSAPDFRCPGEHPVVGPDVPSARRVVSITGNLDPVGGWFLRKQADWAYMQLPATDPANGAVPQYLSFIDEQSVTSVDLAEPASLTTLLQGAIKGDGPPDITVQNPHDWGAYVTRHADQLKQWLTS
jgi:hypothetical protein